MATDFKQIVTLIEDYDLPREAIPTEWLKDARVWEALLEKMPLTAMIRNLGVDGAGRTAQAVLARRSRPLSSACAMPICSSGRASTRLPSSRRCAFTRRARACAAAVSGRRPQKTIDALDEAFYLAFGAVEPSNKRVMLALDVSGSMTAGNIAGVPGLTPRDATAALALVTARTEPNYMVTAFSTQMIPLDISAKMRLNDAIKTVSGLPFGGTDCAQPMLYALENKLKVDQFVVLTDSETWFGRKFTRCRRFAVSPRDRNSGAVGRRRHGRQQFTIADPNDRGMLDVVGMDTATPQVISDFAKGAI